MPPPPIILWLFNNTVLDFIMLKSEVIGEGRMENISKEN